MFVTYRRARYRGVMTELPSVGRSMRTVQCSREPLGSPADADGPQVRRGILRSPSAAPEHAPVASAQVSGPGRCCSTATVGNPLPSPTAEMSAPTVMTRRSRDRCFVTAEVVVLNRNGVGIAADSAATLSGIRPKTYNTANKLFALSAMQPVAIMVYDSSAFGVTPWETIVKTYRDHRKAEPLATISAYAADLIDYLSLKFSCDSVDYRQVFLPQGIVQSELNRLRQMLLEAIVANPAVQPVQESDLNEAIERLIKNRMDELANFPNVEHLDGSGVEEDVAGIRDDLQHRIDETLGSLTGLIGLTSYNISPEVRQLIFELMCRSAMKAGSHPGSSGVVLAGFGDEEMLPALSHFYLDGVVDGTIRRSSIEDKRISEDNRVEIVPFAQKEIIRTLMEGVHPRYSRHNLGMVYYFLEETKEKFGAADEGLVSHCDKFYERMQTNLESYVQKTHSDPIRAIVEHLPKDGLGDMAEALVDITSLTQRITPGSETVGGPTDVAVITKGDGLIWIKRKHYFEPELNPRYFERLSLAK